MGEQRQAASARIQRASRPSGRSDAILEHVFDTSPEGLPGCGRDRAHALHASHGRTVTPMSESWDEVERAALVVLLRERPGKLTWPQIVAEVGERGSARAVLADAEPPDLFGDQESPSMQQALRDIAVWRASGFGFLTFLDDDYPAQLREVHEAPPILFHRGQLVPDETAVSVVGSRDASPEGLDIATSIANWMSNQHITVIAGLAKGIDTAAHTAALETGGRTVAIIGTGITKTYPAENRSLQEDIATKGLLLSQFWPDAPPRKQTFPMRNAVMSGYGRATVVVEASEVSGARIQARQAVAHGRPVILTHLVYDRTEWAQNLVGRPDVYVAKSAKHVTELVERVISHGSAVDELLDRVLASQP